MVTGRESLDLDWLMQKYYSIQLEVQRYGVPRVWYRSVLKEAVRLVGFLVFLSSLSDSHELVSSMTIKLCHKELSCSKCVPWPRA